MKAQTTLVFPKSSSYSWLHTRRCYLSASIETAVLVWHAGLPWQWKHTLRHATRNRGCRRGGEAVAISVLRVWMGRSGILRWAGLQQCRLWRWVMCHRRSNWRRRRARHMWLGWLIIHVVRVLRRCLVHCWIRLVATRGCDRTRNGWIL